MPKKYKILLSAYACEPNKGSEPGIGWNWAITLNKLGHDVTVITRANNKKNIEKYLSENKNLQGINFKYYDLPLFLLKGKKIMGVYLYYELWQRGVLNYAKKNLNPSDFDLVHHITFGVFRQPSHLYKFKKPFIFGPLGGAEAMPKLLLKKLPIKYQLVELIRAKLNKVSLYRMSVINCFRHADIIFTRTNETREIIPNKFKSKTVTKIDIGLYDFEISKDIKVLNRTQTINILYVGRLTYWKGLELAIRSFHQFNIKCSDSIFTVIGSGNYKAEMEILTTKLGIADKVNFIGQIPQTELKKFYENATVFLFPSLHDAGPLVTLEALRVGLPIVALNLGGLGQLLSSNYPTIVNSIDFEKEEVINSLSNLLLKLATDKDFYFECSKESLKKAKNNTWVNTIDKVYAIIENDFNSLPQH